MPSGADAVDSSVETFSLSRWFHTIGLLSILLLAVVCALLLSRLFASRMLLQEGRLTMQFVQSIIDIERRRGLFHEPRQRAQSNYMEELLVHIAGSPDMLRANLYSRERRILWSSDATHSSGAPSPTRQTKNWITALSGRLEVHAEDEEWKSRTTPSPSTRTWSHAAITSSRSTSPSGIR